MSTDSRSPSSQPSRAKRRVNQVALPALAAGASLLASACSASQWQSHELPAPDDAVFAPVTDSQAAPAAMEAAVVLGQSLNRQAFTQGSVNAVSSPLSAIVALAMLTEGACESAAAQLDLVTGLTDAERDQVVAAWITELQQWDRLDEFDADELPETPIVHLANQVVVDDELNPSAEFLKVLSHSYDARALQLDLGDAKSKRVLDEWVHHHSGGLIEKSSVTPRKDLRLVLANAVLFAAKWDEPFKASDTYPQPFTTANGATVDAQMMHATFFRPIADVDGWQAITLPYRDGFDALLILPPEGATPADLSAATYRQLQAMTGTAEPVEVALPSFEITASSDLATVMQTLGATDVFETDQRPLTGIDPDQDLAVGEAVQQARIKVGEDGTVAAAVTEIQVKELAAPMPATQLTFDRPFLMVVRAEPIDAPLFWVEVADPTAK